MPTSALFCCKMEESNIKNVRKMVLSSLFAALTAVCAWISLPIPPVAFTLQTFAVLLTLGTILYFAMKRRNLDTRLFE